MNLHDWAACWGVPPQALQELIANIGGGYRPSDGGAGDENEVQKRVRLDAADSNELTWRNNVGACTDNRGNFIRYGLANESKKVNKKVKSSDLIGIRPVLITPAHVGQTIGQFTARETKRRGWVYTGSEREQAQRNFILLVASKGGYAKFTTGEL